MLLQPVPKQLLHLMGQSQQDVPRVRRTRLRGGFEETLELSVVDSRNHRGREHADRHPSFGQGADDPQAPLR